MNRNILKIFFLKRRILFISFYFFLNICSSQINKYGIPLIKNYSQEVYKAFPQNWQAVQDNRGVMYFANQTCILEFDGCKWRQIKIADNVYIRSLAIDDSGFLYFGTSNSFGYLLPNEKGQLIPVILSDSIHSENQNKYEFWKIVPINNYIYFFSEWMLYRFDKSTSKFNTWELNLDIFQIHSFNNELYFSSFEKGLLKMDGDSIVRLNNGDFFIDKAIVSMLPFSDDSIFIVTYNNGIFKAKISDSLSINISSDDAINKKFKDCFFYSAILLNNNEIAIASIGKGVYVLDKSGDILNIIDEGNGLISNNIASLFISNISHQKNILWAITDKGISKIEYYSPITLFSVQNGLKGLVTDIVRFKDKLYVATMEGLFCYEKDALSGRVCFHKNKIINNEVWKFVIVKFGGNEKLIACTGYNLYEINDYNAVPLTKTYSTISLYQLKKDSTIAYISLDKGLAKLKISKTTFLDLGVVNNSGVSDRVQIFSEDEQGNLWMLSNKDGVIHYDTQKDKVIKLYNLKVDSALPTINCMFECNKTLFLGTKNGIYQYSKPLDKFIPATFFKNNLKIQSLELSRVYVDNNIVWAVIKNEEKKSIGKIDFNKGTIDEVSYKRILEQNVWGFYNDINHKLLIFSTDKLYIYNKGYKKEFKTDYNTLIRKVTLNSDSVIFWGAHYENALKNKKRKLSLNQHPETIKPIKFRYNNISFEFSSPFYESEESTFFSYFLEGNDDTWSEWTARTDKEYTNLFEGRYTFKVKARNVYGNESRIASYSFIILPPWYRTIWAYISYLILLILLIFVIVKLSIYRLQKINEAYGKYLPGSFLKMLDKRRIIDFKLGDMVEKEMTIMFSDIRSYTKLSESMSPQDNFKFLVRYLKHVGEMLNKNKGFPVQYYGDGVMAMFHGITDNPVQAAIDMHKKVTDYSADRVKKGRSEIKIGIGLHTGKVIMGIRGDKWRWEGGIVGDAVNISSRIEGLTKIFGAATVISEDVYNKIEKPQTFKFRYLGNVKVKGKDKTLKIFELIDGNPPYIFNAKINILEDFNKAITLFQNKNFDEALSMFTSIRERYDDLASAYYIDVINNIKTKPQCNFDGTLVIDIK